jgi:peptide deformylase
MIKLVKYPDKRLKMKSKPMEKVTENTRDLVKTMGKIMLAQGGVGLSAIQLGIPARLIVVSDERFGLIPMANPEIIARSDDNVRSIEGCLSFKAGMGAVVLRSNYVKVRWLNMDNVIEERDFDGMASSVIQHEIDHLDGITMLDRNKQAGKRIHELQFKNEAEAPTGTPETSTEPIPPTEG